MPRGLDRAHPHDRAQLLSSVPATGGAVVSLYRPGTEASGATLRASASLFAARAVILIEAWTTLREHGRQRLGPYGLPPHPRSQRATASRFARNGPISASIPYHINEPKSRKRRVDSRRARRRQLQVGRCRSRLRPECCDA
ncbi:hypothetical protein [Streptomyces mirabilis]|uniref:hypothetical protein n=1 Tax=Streptomyces mirabilis TaxID=68239 RepID=UPI0033B6F6BB